MKCIICNTEFEGRSDARYCSANCRVKGNRLERTADIVRPESVPAPEILKKAPDFEKREKTARMLEAEKWLTTPFGQVRQQWDPEHPIENLEGGYLHVGQSQAEYIKNIHELGYNYDGTKCEHPVSEQLYSRCLHCGDMISWVKRDGKPLLKGIKKK